MGNEELQDTTVKSIRFEKELCDKIDRLREEAERDFSQQVRFMLKEYIRQKETK
jgi:metal-responsive CopG/Arc/MetJ family transcriptional regulator